MVAAAATLPRPYYRVLGASGLSNLADGIRMAAFPLLAASLTDEAVLIALVFIAGEAPWLVFGLWAGSLADRVERRSLIRRITLVRTVLLAALAALVMVDATPLGLVVLAAFALGTAEVVADSATGTLVPSLVSDDQLERANSRMVAAQITGNELAGPALGGVLFAAGAALPFVTNSSLLAVALLVLAGLPLLPPDRDLGEASEMPAARPRPLDGIPYVRSHPLLLALTGSSALLAAVDAAWFALLVLFVRDQLGFGPAGFGLFLAVGAVGGLVGAAVADRRPRATLRTAAPVVFASTAISLIALALAPNPVTTATTLIVTSGAFAVWNVHAVSARQRATPHHLLGRVGATYRTAAVTASILGALTGGLVADLASLRSALAGYGLVLLVATPFATRALRRSVTSLPPFRPPT